MYPRIVLHLSAWFLATVLQAQPGSLDTSFNPNDIGFGSGSGVNNDVQAIVMQPDGRVLVAGYFTQYNTQVLGKVVRLMPDGTLDNTFQPGISPGGGILALALQPDGKIICAGAFTNLQGFSRNRVARLNADGSMDTTFDPGFGCNSHVNAVALQPDGRILIGGAFSTYDGVARYGVARLLPNGDLDTSFDPGSGASSEVQCLALRPTGEVLIGGFFTSFGGGPVGRLVQVDSSGAVDPAFDTTVGANNNVAALALQPNGDLLIAGGFSTWNGASRPRLARVLPNGTADPAFQPATGADAFISAMALQQDGRILIGGAFTQYQGTARPGLARVEAGGSLDATFDPGTGPGNIIGPSGITLLAIALRADGHMLVGGSYQAYDGRCCGGLCLVKPGGAYDGSFNPVTSANGLVNDIVMQPDGKLLVGGFFVAYDSTLVQRIVRLLPDGERDTTFASGVGTANSGLEHILLQPDGRIVCVGNMSSWSGSPVGRIVRLNADGSVDGTFAPISGANAGILTAALQPDGRILIGGFFTEYDGQPAAHIARLNADGTLDPTFNPGIGAEDNVWAMALQPDGGILIGGEFIAFNGQPRAYLARLLPDGSLDPAFLPTAGANSHVYSVAVQADGAIVIGGVFSVVNSTPRNRVGRLNADGSLDTTFEPVSGANGVVRCIRPLVGGGLLIGGSFFEYDGLDRGRVARLNADGTLDQTFGTGDGADDEVKVITELPDGNFMIGGWFLSYDGIGRNRIARIFGGSSTGQAAAPEAARCTVHPNPSSGLFTLLMPEVGPVQWTVVDGLGRVVRSGSGTAWGTRHAIDLNGQAPGCYVISVTGEALHEQVRVVLQ